ncbi:MAG TPA: hypothetical protein VGE41_04115 [Verrucomicrobiae bacterium]|jgi:hypothetical protein
MVIGPQEQTNILESVREEIVFFGYHGMHKVIGMILTGYPQEIDNGNARKMFDSADYCAEVIIPYQRTQWHRGREGRRDGLKADHQTNRVDWLVQVLAFAGADRTYQSAEVCKN